MSVLSVVSPATLSQPALTAKREYSPVGVGNLVSLSTSSTTPKDHFLTPLTICFRFLSHPLMALVNSGDKQSFIDCASVTRLGIPLIPLPHRLDAKALNGTGRFRSHLVNVT